jgi:hypothetical protein
MTNLSLCTSAQYFITGCHYTVILYSYQHSALTLKLLKNTTVSTHLVPLCGGLQQVAPPPILQHCPVSNWIQKLNESYSQPATFFMRIVRNLLRCLENNIQMEREELILSAVP